MLDDDDDLVGETQAALDENTEQMGRIDGQLDRIDDGARRADKLEDKFETWNFDFGHKSKGYAKEQKAALGAAGKALFTQGLEGGGGGGGEEDNGPKAVFEHQRWQVQHWLATQDPHSHTLRVDLPPPAPANRY